MHRSLPLQYIVSYGFKRSFWSGSGLGSCVADGSVLLLSIVDRGVIEALTRPMGRWVHGLTNDHLFKSGTETGW